MKTRHSEKAPWVRQLLGKESIWYFNQTAPQTNQKDSNCPFAFGTGNEAQKPRYIRFETKYFYDFSATHFYVSLACLIKLGEDQIMGGGTPGQQDSDGPAWVDEEEIFMEDGCAEWQMKQADGTEISARDEAGNVHEVTIHVTGSAGQSNNWTKAVRKVLGVGGGKSFKPTRQSNISFHHPLLIKPLETHEQMIRARFGDFTQFFVGAIKEVNDTRDTEDQQDQEDGEWTLELFDAESTRDTTAYFELSKDPFDLYTTWIHQDDWNKYMTSLVSDNNTSPIRKFISFKNEDDEAYKVMDKLMTAVGDRDMKVQAKLFPKERKAIGLDPQQRKDDQIDAKELGRPVTAAAKNRRFMSVTGLQKRYKFLGGETRIEVQLDERKMAAAAGKRGREQSQKAVMGNVSATEVATELEWEAGRMESGFYSSEWLHLSAFSWGGYMDPGARSGQSSSQNLENLVFGTSETNSLMTRYEMAWQDFLRKEQQLADEWAMALGRTGANLQGGLKIICNDFSKPIAFDMLRPGGYRIEYLEFNQDFVKDFNEKSLENSRSDEPELMCKRYFREQAAGVQDLSGVNGQGSTTYGQMLTIAHDFSFIVYVMQYQVQCEFHSMLLGTPRAGNTFNFYPFRRSLYHSAETILDAVLWDKLKEGAQLAMQQEFAALQQQQADAEEARRQEEAALEQVRADTGNQNNAISEEMDSDLRARKQEIVKKWNERVVNNGFERFNQIYGGLKEKVKPFTIERNTRPLAFG